MKNPNSVEFDAQQLRSDFYENSKKIKCRWKDSNREPHSPKPNALPTELTSRVGILGLNYRIRRINT